jgi:hypothetical protein
MWKLWSLLALVTLSLGLGGCIEKSSQELHFETISQSNSANWEDREPGLVIIDSAEEAKEVLPFIQNDDKAILGLNQLDFSNQFAILAFRGWQPTVLSGFQVDHIVRQGRTVTFRAKSGELDGQDMVTSPYHLVKVHKDETWGRTYTFKLYFDEMQQDAVSITHYVQ